MCRRCTQVCPIGVDNMLITHELRKIFSQELGIAAAEIHEKGSVKHLKFGSSTGMIKAAVEDIIEYLEDDIEEKTGKKIKIPINKKGADVLLLHNAGEFMAWPENPMAFAILFDAAGINYTLSTDLLGYDAVNYGLWYDDVQFARVALKHLEVARDLGVKKIVIGECGHAHKALTVVADRLLPGEQLIPRESSYTLLWDIVKSGKIKFDPNKNDFPVTLHDPCNVVRIMGIVKPQRNVLNAIFPPGRFREMTPHGVENYCCGGGSGFAIMESGNFPDWRRMISGRKKLTQVPERLPRARWIHPFARWFAHRAPTARARSEVFSNTMRSSRRPASGTPGSWNSWSTPWWIRRSPLLSGRMTKTTTCE